MSKTVLSEVDGFTPLIDSLTREHGIITAAVFGRMWRYCQGDRGVCQATLERIGDDLGIDKATVQRHAVKLCDLGYLEDTTPTLRNKPHTYRDTGKAALAINVHVAENNVTLQSATSDCTVQRHVAESQLKKEVKRQPKKEKTGGAKEPPRRDELFDAIAEVCQVDPHTAGPQIGKVKSVLAKAQPPYTPAEVRSFGEWWWGWKERQAAPTVWKLQELIGQVRHNGKHQPAESAGPWRQGPR